MSPHSENPGLLLLKYREHLQKLYSLDTWCLTEQTNVLRSNTTSNRINQYSMTDMANNAAYQLCPHQLLHTQNFKYFNKLVGPRTFQNPSRNIIYTIGCSDYFFIHDSFDAHTWYFESFWRDHPYDNIINIKVHKYLPYAWKYLKIDSTELIQKRGFWLAAHNREAPEFNTLEQRLYKLGVILQKTSLIPSSF